MPTDPSSESSPHAPIPTLSACDLCHTRKIRCDRQDPCDRCILSSVQCLRTRQISRTRRRRRPWLIGSRSQTTLAAAVGPDPSFASHATQSVSDDHQSHGALASTPPSRGASADRIDPRVSYERSPGELTERPGSRQSVLSHAQDLQSPCRDGPWDHIGSKSNIPSNQSSGEKRIAAGYEAQAYFKKELAECDRLSCYARDILQVAVELVSQFGQGVQACASDSEEAMSDDRDLFDTSMYPSDEVVCFLSTGSQTVAGVFYSELTSFISRSTFERMAYALIDKEVQGHTRAEFLVCVNFFMLTSIGLEEEYQTNLIKERMRLLRERYRKNALTALNRISVLNPPSLSLLQALLAGAMLFQMSGNVDKCAQLSSSACLVCSQLGGRYFAELAANASQQDSLEVRQCIGHCYTIDKSLSMSLGRRSFLPEMEVNAAMLMPIVAEMPSTPISNIYLELAKVQDEVACEMRAQQSSRSPEARLLLIQTLRSRMEDIRVKSSQFRTQPPQSTDQLLQGEWMGVDFTYYSIHTAITRLHPFFASDRHVRGLCLDDARRSLLALRNMERHGLGSPMVWNAYCLSITWVVLLCPLCPFFALFCHIVETSNPSDLHLLRDVTEGLEVFEKSSLSISKVRDLFDILVTLCKERLEDL